MEGRRAPFVLAAISLPFNLEEQTASNDSYQHSEMSAVKKDLQTFAECQSGVTGRALCQAQMRLTCAGCEARVNLENAAKCFDENKRVASGAVHGEQKIGLA